MPNTTERQEKPKVKTVGGSVSAQEMALIEAARERAGIRSISEFVRETMLARAKRILEPKRAADRQERAA
jgi:uncharacterized protein (DUF1778 family)